MYSKLVKSIFIISCGLSFYSHSVDITFGSIEVIEFNSDVIGAREISLYQPHSIEINSQTRFIIFQDGQMLFDASRSWNKQEWRLDETFLELNNENIRPNMVIIGVNSANKSGKEFFDNTNRYLEYFPKQAVEYMDAGFVRIGYNRMASKPRYQYLDFVVKELIPFLEIRYDTTLNRQNLGIMGASMGALAALNAILEYPDLFGFAGCFSTHWVGIKPLEYLTLMFRKNIKGDQKTIDALVEYVRDMIPNLDSHQLYFDRGTAGLDKSYRDPQIRIDSILEKSSIDFESLVFEGEDHQEKFWAKRFKAWLVKMQDRM